LVLEQQTRGANKKIKTEWQTFSLDFNDLEGDINGKILVFYYILKALINLMVAL